MKMLFIRLLSWMTGMFGLIAALLQWRDPQIYPWPLAIFFVWFLLAIILMSWRMSSWRITLEKMAPSVLATCAVALAFLMAEDTFHRIALSSSLVLFTALPLELFFFSLYDASRYPVNSLSHVNIALAPLSIFYVVAGFSGLRVFIELPWWVPCIVIVGVSAWLYSLTEHPVADSSHRMRWRFLGAFIGLHIVLFLLVLPVNVWVLGVFMAFLFAMPLRIRRYAYAPVPSRRVAVVEIICSATIFLFILLGAQWA